MLKIDNSLLEEVGLGTLPDAEKNSLLKHIYETLEMRVGIRLADQMTNQQLDEFEKYFEAKDDAGAFKWLETNFPNYKEIVQEEFNKLKAEVAQTAPQILATSPQQAAGQPSAAPQATVPAAPAPVATPQPQQFAAPAPTDQPPVQGPNTQAPQYGDHQAAQPQTAPAPAQPYSAPPAPQAPPQPQQPPVPPAPPQPPYPTQQPPAGPQQ